MCLLKQVIRFHLEIQRTNTYTPTYIFISCAPHISKCPENYSEKNKRRFSSEEDSPANIRCTERTANQKELDSREYTLQYRSGTLLFVDFLLHFDVAHEARIA